MVDAAASAAYDYNVSPSPKSAGNDRYSDRLIPNRNSSNLENGYGLLEDANIGRPNGVPDLRENGVNAYNHLLRTEVLGMRGSFSPGGSMEGFGKRPFESNNLFRFQPSERFGPNDPFTLSPVAFRNSDLLNAPRKIPRKISKVPFKVLDAPQLQDDFYLNLVDWSSMNCVAVGLNTCVYLWSACTSRVTKLCDLGQEDLVTSVGWAQRGTHLAVGTNRGHVQIWDAARCRKLRTMTGHTGRVGTMAWNGHILSTGSRDHDIYHRDVRQQSHFMSKLTGHKQEVCGLRWSYDEQQLASGGNDNKLCVWSLKSTTPVLKFSEHQAAVKAIAWSPHQRGLLSSGGGTADRCIRFWNTVNSTPLSCVDTGSQVCNLIWSKNANEIVSTHGYSLNQIALWKYPSMSEVVTLTGHTYRVLYLAISPDGQTIVTGAGDETLRFWNVFPGTKCTPGSVTLPLNQTIR